MADWDVRIEFDCMLGDPDVAYIEVEADTVEQAARVVWDEWHETGWDQASISGRGDWLWINLDLPEFNFSRETS